MKIERLIKMANDISRFFDAETDKTVAAQGMKDHISQTWEIRMRETLLDYVKKDGSGLTPLALQALKSI